MPTMSGSDFCASLPATATAAREQAILDAVKGGLQVPIIWLEMRAEHAGHKATVFVSSDALRVGHADDSVRVNVTADS